MDIAALEKIQDRILDTLEKRFLSHEGIIFDYVGLDGKVILPTPEECKKNQPNAFAWNTPIENGAFFNGDLLLALLRCWEKRHSKRLERVARTLLKGLFVLQDKSPVPGCILRGLGSDDKCSYPCSSNDQVVPFLLGVWSFSNAPFATQEEREDCRNRCYTLVKELEKNNWIVPGTKAGFERGKLDSLAPHCGCHLIIAAMILDKMENSKEARLQKLLIQRGDYLSEGHPQIQPHESWYSSHNFYILRMFAEQLGENPHAEKFRKALSITAHALLPALTLWKKWQPEETFSPDWHVLNQTWFEQKNSADAQKCTNPQWAIWDKASPAVMNERRTIMAAFSSAWIILMSEDKKLIAEVTPQIIEMLKEVPYEKLYYAPFFFALNVISELPSGNA